MRHIILVSLLLVLVLAVCLCAFWYISVSAERIAVPFPALYEAIRAQDWTSARAVYDACKQEWQKTERMWRVMINHDDMRDLEVAFIDLDTAIRQQDGVEAERELAELEFFLDHVPDTERVDWGNIL